MTTTRFSFETRHVKLVAGAVSAVAIVATTACGASTGQTAFAQPAMAASAPLTQPGSPVVVSCEPNQRTLVRPVVVNGATVSQMECISTGASRSPPPLRRCMRRRRSSTSVRPALPSRYRS